MIERFSAAPWTFWLHLVVAAILIVEALRKWNFPWAKPALAVYTTLLFWYTGDFLLSDPRDYFVFTREVVSLAFFQVALFLVIFRWLLGFFSRRFCQKPLREARQNSATTLRNLSGAVSPRLLKSLLVALILGWLGIFLIGLSFAGGQWPALIWPPLNPNKVGMYPLQRVGSGGSFIFSIIGYVHVLVCALFGVVAMLARGPVRWIAAAMAALTWPYFWFDRYRSKMLALLLPGLAAFLLLGKHSLIKRIVVSICFAIVLTMWFSKVMSFRAEGDFTAFADSADGEEEADMRRNASQGQDMLKELCWINTFIPSGRYRPNWGARYLAEIVNPVPRAIWPNKPMVGIDYAMARGFSGRRDATDVFATISTGMIGQGCVNFGRFLGVGAAALLFALWAAFLARLWCQQASATRLILFLLGIGLTFNTGRDLTLLVLFPFVFGYVAMRIYERLHRKSVVWQPNRPAATAGTPVAMTPTKDEAPPSP